jgi:ABC-type transport system involved in multi-copper enzyme maturation permease subunit
MKEVLKSKILLNVFLIGLGMMLITFVASEFTYGVPGKVALDFGLGMLWFSSCGISLFMGVTLIAKEIDSRTVYMIISRPVPRYAFVLGKVVGLVSVLVINIFLLSLMTLLTTHLLGGRIDELVYWAVAFTLIESILLLLVVIFFSLNVNSIITVLISVILLLSGHANAEQLKALQDWVQEVRRAAEGPENAPIEPAAVQYSAGKQPIHRKDKP